MRKKQNKSPLDRFNNLPQFKQTRICQAAIREFSEKGYIGTSINSLVEGLGIAKGSIFQYFGDKKGLFRFVFDEATELVKERLRAIRNQTADDDLFSRLEQTLFSGVLFLQEHPLIYNLYLKVLFEPKIPFREDILLSIREYSFKYLRSLLETAAARGELRDNVDIDKACFVIDAVMDRFLQAKAIHNFDGGLGLQNAGEEEVKEWISDLLDIMRIGLGK